MLSIAAGVMISIGGIIFLTLSGLEGALLFSMGLLTILCLKLELFTGKAGLLTTNEITPGKLLEIWIGNFLGTLGTAYMSGRAAQQQHGHDQEQKGAGDEQNAQSAAARGGQLDQSRHQDEQRHGGQDRRRLESTAGIVRSSPQQVRGDENAHRRQQAGEERQGS